MSDRLKTALWVLSGLLCCAGARAIFADSANPYQGIVERNVFGLKPPPPAQKPEPDKPPAPKVTLNGITTILGKPRAFMSMQMPAKPPEPAKPQTFMLSPGQRDGDVEVLEINEKLDGGTVKVSTFGTVQTLTMDKDGAKLPVGAPVPTPGMPPVAFAPQPGGVAYPAGADPGLKPLPIRQLRVPDSAGNQAASPNSASTPPTSTLAQGQPQPGRVRPLNAEEQALSMLTQHVQMTDQGHEMPPLPPPLAEVLQESPQPQTQPGTLSPKISGPSFPPRAPGLPQTLPPSLPP